MDLRTAETVAHGSKGAENHDRLNRLASEKGGQAFGSPALRLRSGRDVGPREVRAQNLRIRGRAELMSDLLHSGIQQMVYGFTSFLPVEKIVLL